MTNDLTLITTPVLQVVFPNDFPDADKAGTTGEPVPLTDVLREGDNIVNISDTDLIERVALHYDLPTTHFNRMQVTRPETGHIIISEKFMYGIEFELVRTTREIYNLWDGIDEFGPSKFPGMTYEQGICAAFAWLTDLDVEAII